MEGAPKSEYEGLPAPDVEKILEIKSMLREIADTDFLEFDDLMVQLTKLRESFKDYDTELHPYKLWHAVVAGSIIPEKMPEMDLPGNVIENMVKAKLEKVRNK